MADSTLVEEVERILTEALGMGEKVAWDFFREGWVEDLRNKILWVDLEVVVELMGEEDRVGEGEEEDRVGEGEEEEGTLGEAVEAMKEIPVGVEVDPTILERVSRMNAVTMNLGMVR